MSNYAFCAFEEKKYYNVNCIISSIMLIDWLIDWCLTSSEQFFSYIQDENI